MLQSGVGYTFDNSSRGSSLTIDTIARYKETLPFFVYEDTNEAGSPIFRINAGTFNNQFPTVNGAQVGSSSAYLAAPSSSGLVVMTIAASQNAFPASTPTIAFLSASSVPGNSPSVAYVAIARINAATIEGSAQKAYSVDNLVSGSLWGERFECGEELEYWFSRI